MPQVKMLQVNKKNVEKTDSYEELVKTSPQGSIYCNRWWLDAVAPGNYKILSIERGDQLLAAWPIVMSGRRIVMPDMTQKLGILFAPFEGKYSEQLSKEHQLIEELMEQLPQNHSFSHRFHENFTNWLPFYWHDYEQTTRYTYLIRGLSDPDALWKEMRGRARTDIRKASKNGLTVVEMEFERFLDLNDQTYYRQGISPPVPRETLRRINNACVENAGSKVFAAEDSQGCVHAAVYIVWHGGVAYYLMGGSDPQMRNSGASKLALWEAIRFASQVAHTFDFEGSVMRKIEHAFREMGGRQIPYFVIDKVSPMERAWRRSGQALFNPGKVINHLVRFGRNSLTRRRAA